MPVMLLDSLVGQRVVLRYRRTAATAGPAFSDVVGELISVEDDTATVSARRGQVTLRRSDIAVVRAVAANRGEILELERISRRGWRAREVTDLDGWELHADRGWTGRANSVLPLRTPGRPVAELLAEAGRFYAERGLPLQVQLPLPARGLLDAELAGRCWRIERPTIMLTRSLTQRWPDEPLVSTAQLHAEPSPEWLAAYHYRGGRLPGHAIELLTRHDRVRFAAVTRDGRVVGIARGTVDEGWLGVTAVEVAPEHRRAGVATDLMLALRSWAGGEGASRCYLQVDSANTLATALYQRLGFTEHHRYHYRIEPGAAEPTGS